MGASLRVNPVKEILLLTATLIRDSLFATSVEPLDGRVRSNVVLLSRSLAVGSISVDLGNQNVLIISKVTGNRLPDRGKVLAV